ncbi:MAG: hypothetical protein J1E01_09305 [Acetatifactor sp.]|nr:hypothetical protein [Acetatifactor sp.]
MKAANYEHPALAREKKEAQKVAEGRIFAKVPIEKLAVAAARQAHVPMKISHQIQHGIVDGTRTIVNMDELLERLETPLDQAGQPVEIHTRETAPVS